MLFQKISIPPPHGGHFSFRPRPPWNFHFRGCLSDPPASENLRTIPTWLGTPLERIVTSKMLLRYTIMRKLIVSAIKREKNPFIHVSTVSYNLNFALERSFLVNV